MSLSVYDFVVDVYISGDVFDAVLIIAIIVDNTRTLIIESVTSHIGFVHTL